ncbi:MAG: hypothetical protein AB7O59_01005 [Pirellulales bacterium]
MALGLSDHELEKEVARIASRPKDAAQIEVSAAAHNQVTELTAEVEAAEEVWREACRTRTSRVAELQQRLAQAQQVAELRDGAEQRLRASAPPALQRRIAALRNEASDCRENVARVDGQLARARQQRDQLQQTGDREASRAAQADSPLGPARQARAAADLAETRAAIRTVDERITSLANEHAAAVTQLRALSVKLEKLEAELLQP